MFSFFRAPPPPELEKLSDAVYACIAANVRNGGGTLTPDEMRKKTAENWPYSETAWKQLFKGKIVPALQGSYKPYLKKYAYTDKYAVDSYKKPFVAIADEITKAVYDAWGNGKGLSS